MEGNGRRAGPNQHKTIFISKFSSLSGRRTLSRRRCISFTHDVRLGQGGEFATVAEARHGDESCDSVDGRSIASVAIEKDDLPYEVEKSIDVIECDDGFVARILTGQTERIVLEGHGEMENKKLGGGNDEGNDTASGMERIGDVGPLISQDIKGV
ncbi:unnamed protein product [Prunus armeniaca]|uniref:Uncharacterized protein n=1 Tax=Prunus armeniaca TaxID=36596 RepID=A0A6J5XDD5_PRUAR|nr:unnamed protein product [Prunus armeniaca]